MRYIITLFSMLSLLFACTSNDATQDKPATLDRGSALEAIDQAETQLKAKSTKQLDKTLANELLQKTNEFVKAFPKDPEAPQRLFRAAEVARGMGNAKKAVFLFGEIHRDYPDYEKAPAALFLKAFLLETMLDDRAEAKKFYTHFVNNYPDHQLIPQVKQLLEVIDKSPEEMVREFQQKNKK